MLAALSGCGKEKAEPVPAAPKDAAPASVTRQTAPAPVTPEAAPPPPPDARAATRLDDTARRDICDRVVEKLSDCYEDPAFIAALTAGLTGAELKAQRTYVAEVADWPPGFCGLWEYDWEYNGFRDHMEQLTDPQIVASCATLGTALKAAGGLTGGDMVK